MSVPKPALQIHYQEYVLLLSRKTFLFSKSFNNSLVTGVFEGSSSGSLFVLGTALIAVLIALGAVVYLILKRNRSKQTIDTAPLPSTATADQPSKLRNALAEIKEGNGN